MADPRNPVLLIKELGDTYLQKNFEALAEYFRTQNQLLDFQLVDATFTEATVGKKLAHTLGSVPLDVFITRLSFDGVSAPTVTWNYDDFTTNSVSVTVTGACRLRAFIGTYRGNR